MLKLITVFLMLTPTLYGFNERDYERAISLVDQQEYAKAEILFQEALSYGCINGSIYFNLATIAFRQAHLGQAMAYLLSARKHLPRDPDVEANLNFMMGKIQDRVEAKDLSSLQNFIFWRTWFNKSELFYALTFFLISSCLLFFTYGVQKKYSKVLKKLSLMSLTLSGLMGAMLLTLWLTQKDWGAVVVNQSQIRSGPGEHHAVLFELHEGAPFMLEKEQKDWFQILLSDGKKGWVSQREARVY